MGFNWFYKNKCFTKTQGNRGSTGVLDYTCKLFWNGTAYCVIGRSGGYTPF